MAVFDLYVCYTLNVSFVNSIIWGFLIISPVGFDENIVRNVINIETPSFLYCSVVILYRLCSYILLAILIASYGGYFKGRN